MEALTGVRQRALVRHDGDGWSVALEFKAADLWVGVFPKVTRPRLVCHCGDWCDTHSRTNGHNPVPMPNPSQVDVWVCLLPCLPLHFTWLVWR